MTLLTAQSMIRWRLSLGAQEMWGVMMQFFAFSRGLSPRMGSVETTSRPAAASLPAFSASARSCSTTRGPRLLLRRMAPSFILAMVSRLMIPSVSGNRGQWRATTSDRARRASRSTYSAMARPASLGWLS